MSIRLPAPRVERPRAVDWSQLEGEYQRRVAELDAALAVLEQQGIAIHEATDLELWSRLVEHEDRDRLHALMARGSR